MTGVRWSGGGGPKAGIGVGPEIGKGGCVGVVDGGSSERSMRWFWFGRFACGAGDAHIKCVTALAQSQRQKPDVGSPWVVMEISCISCVGWNWLCGEEVGEDG